MVDWSSVIEAVLTIINLVIIGDGRLVWQFVIGRRLVKGDIISLNNNLFLSRGMED